MSPFDAQQVLHVNLSRGRSCLPILEERSLGSSRKNTCPKYLFHQKCGSYWSKRLVHLTDQNLISAQLVQNKFRYHMLQYMI
jgi:hypothetical protein